MFHPYLDTAILVLVYVTIWFIIAQIKGDNSVVDVAWGLGFVAVVWWQQIFYPHKFSLLLTIMVTLWGVRLGSYLFFRNRKHGEDWRYKQMKKSWKGNLYLMAYLRVFLLQGVIMYVISLMLVHPVVEVSPLANYLQVFGILLFIIGFLWESIADFQLQQFKSDPFNKGQYFKGGLWAYSRHPNYFGEILLWWGLFLFASSYGTWYINILSPIIITFLLLKVSGIPFLEQKRKKDPKYTNYLKEVPNAIIPKF